MKSFTSFLLAAFVTSAFVTSASAATGDFGEIVRIEPELDALIAPDATMEVLAEGHDWIEGPVWDSKGGRLLYSDIPRNTIYEWSEAGGRAVFMKPSGYTGVIDYGREPGSNGLAFDNEGHLLAAEHGDRRISQLTKGGGKITLADRFEGKRFNSPNDLVVHSSGAVYFTDPPYGLPRDARESLRELDFLGVYRLAPDGTVTALIRDLPAPNGVTLSPDEKILYVAQSDGRAPVVMAYPLLEDGTVGEGRVFFDATPFRSTGSGSPDGLKTDIHGNIWTTGPGGVLVLSPDGTVLGQLKTGRNTANLAFGGPDGSTLFITADDILCRIETLTQGAGL